VGGYEALSEISRKAAKTQRGKEGKKRKEKEENEEHLCIFVSSSPLCVLAALREENVSIHE
jgi:hypothetical protein